MQLKIIEDDLRNRISEGRDMLASGGMELPGDFDVRDFPCFVKPLVFLDDPDRIERNGVSFSVSIRGPKNIKSVVLNVRIKAAANIGKTVHSPPYVVVYVVDQASGNEDELIHENLDDADSYERLLGLTTPQWYANRVRMGLSSKNRRKLFHQNMEVILNR